MDFIEARYPGRPNIEAYGDGGFRFGGGSHVGALLFLPDGVLSWTPDEPGGLELSHFEAVFAQKQAISLFLLGSGEALVFPSQEIRRAFATHGVGLEVMNTGAACRTYNVLLSENRAVAAGVLPVE
ncbi:MAG: hypothetical protein C0605_04125 [Hyphomicrobiales bacterium]|nr:MAG: hypothetical protein C0605_04125 [Hyphomicrobiales bacterium]